MIMPLHPTWTDIAIRLLLTLVAGGLMGFNREAQGHAAGFRTTILVALAASVAMIQTNLLLPMDGKEPGSFAVMDLMRLPLGILTGVGFIGGGAILKKGNSIKGVTTAATLWIATVIGLCFGGGQLELGAVATGLAILTIWAMKWVDGRIARERRAALIVRSDAGNAPPPIESLLRPLGYRVRLRQQKRAEGVRDDEEVETHFDLLWKQASNSPSSFEFMETVGRVCRVHSVELVSQDDQ